MVTASEAREPDAYRDCSNRLLDRVPALTPLPADSLVDQGLKLRRKLWVQGARL